MTEDMPSSEAIDKRVFLQFMTICWKDYGNVSYDELTNEWGLLCDLFNDSIGNNDPKVYSFNATMGLGKSLASQVACGVLAWRSWNPVYFFAESNTNIGALLVVERQRTAEEAAEKINQIYNDLGGPWGNPAIAKHSGNDVRCEEIQEHPVLVICHSSYTNSLQRFSDGKTGQFASFSRWEHGPRRLVIVDESINPVQNYVLDPQDIHTIMGWFRSTQLSMRMKRDFPVEFQLLKQVAAKLEELEEKEFNKDESTEHFHQLLKDVPNVKLQRLYEELKIPEVEWDLLIDQKRNALVRMERQKKVLNFFRSIDQLLYEWSFYFREGKRGTARSAQWIIPDDVGSLVILDGTADQDMIYDLFHGELERRTAAKIRRFDNVNLHIKKEKAGLGKSATSTEAKKRAITVYDWLRNNLPEDKRVLVCGHKGIEDHFKSLHRTTPHFQEFHVAHWGAATGSNEWKECDTVVVVSLPYRDHAWAASSITTRLGLLEGLQALQNESKESAAKKLANSKTAVDVLQLLFRCRIRKVKDSEGGCESADLYLMVSNDYRGEDILERVTAEMPGVQVKPWKFRGYSMTAEQADKRLEDSSEGAIIRWLKELPSGITPAKELWETGLVSRDKFNRRWKVRLQNEHDQLHQFMVERGVTFQASGYGRHQRMVFSRA